MQKLIDLLKGKKTYLTAIVAGLLAAAQALGYPIPEYVYAFLGAVGLATLRAAVPPKA
jgi:hypothetical protein